MDSKVMEKSWDLDGESNGIYVFWEYTNHVFVLVNTYIFLVNMFVLYVPAYHVCFLHVFSIYCILHVMPSFLHQGFSLFYSFPPLFSFSSRPLTVFPCSFSVFVHFFYFYPLTFKYSHVAALSISCVPMKCYHSHHARDAYWGIHRS